MNFTVTLPWPSSALSPNARGHWAIKARAAKGYRAACAWKARADGLRKIKARRLTVNVVFHPPTNRLRDLDNLIASFKSGQDGLADVCGVDDSKWASSWQVGEIRKSGAVVVTLCPPFKGQIT